VIERGVVKTVLDRIPEPKNVTMLMMTGILGGGVDPKYSEYVVCLYHSNVYYTPSLLGVLLHFSFYRRNRLIK